MDSHSLYYSLAVSLVLFLAPWLCAAATIVLIQRAMSAEKKKERKAMRGHNSNNYNRLSTHTAVFFANAHLWNELRYFDCTDWLPMDGHFKVNDVQQPFGHLHW